MNKAIIGRKVGMTQVFMPDGKVIPVTVVEAGPCPVVQIKTIEKDVERDHYMTADEALKYGLIDEIIAPRR